MPVYKRVISCDLTTRYQVARQFCECRKSAGNFENYFCSIVDETLVWDTVHTGNSTIRQRIRPNLQFIFCPWQTNQLLTKSSLPPSGQQMWSKNLKNPAGIQTPRSDLQQNAKQHIQKPIMVSQSNKCVRCSSSSFRCETFLLFFMTTCSHNFSPSISNHASLWKLCSRSFCGSQKKPISSSWAQKLHLGIQQHSAGLTCLRYPTVKLWKRQFTVNSCQQCPSCEIQRVPYVQSGPQFHIGQKQLPW